MIELHIIRTGKSYSPQSEYRVFDEGKKLFDTLVEAKAWLKSEYGTSKRVPMYQDQREGPPKTVGYVYGFRNADISHYPVNKWLQQDWVSFHECKAINPEGE